MDGELELGDVRLDFFVRDEDRLGDRAPEQDVGEQPLLVLAQLQPVLEGQRDLQARRLQRHQLLAHDRVEELHPARAVGRRHVGRPRVLPAADEVTHSRDPVAHVCERDGVGQDTRGTARASSAVPARRRRASDAASLARSVPSASPRRRGQRSRRGRARVRAKRAAAERTWSLRDRRGMGERNATGEVYGARAKGVKVPPAGASVPRPPSVKAKSNVRAHARSRAPSPRDGCARAGPA